LIGIHDTEHLNQTKMRDPFTLLYRPQHRLLLFTAHDSVRHGLDTPFTDVRNEHWIVGSSKHTCLCMDPHSRLTQSMRTWPLPFDLQPPIRSFQFILPLIQPLISTSTCSRCEFSVLYSVWSRCNPPGWNTKFYG